MALLRDADAERAFSIERNRDGAQGAHADYARVYPAYNILLPTHYVDRIFEYYKTQIAKYAAYASAYKRALLNSFCCFYLHCKLSVRILFSGVYNMFATVYLMFGLPSMRALLRADLRRILAGILMVARCRRRRATTALMPPSERPSSSTIISSTFAQLGLKQVCSRDVQT